MDISIRKEAIQKVRDSEQQYRESINFLDIGFFTVSLDGIIINHNPAFNKIFGADPEMDLRGTKSFNLWESSEDRDRFIETLKKNGLVQNYLVPAKKLNGEKIFLLGNIHVNYNKEGIPISSEGTFIDITEKINLENKLKLSEQKYRKAYEHENFYKDLFAHDMNNILQNMLMSLELGLLKFKETNENEECKNRLIEAQIL